MYILILIKKSKCSVATSDAIKIIYIGLYVIMYKHINNLAIPNYLLIYFFILFERLNKMNFNV